MIYVVCIAIAVTCLAIGFIMAFKTPEDAPPEHGIVKLLLMVILAFILVFLVCVVYTWCNLDLNEIPYGEI